MTRTRTTPFAETETNYDGTKGVLQQGNPKVLMIFFDTDFPSWYFGYRMHWVKL